MKYAMILISNRLDERDVVHYRRVLIEYKTERYGVFYKTRLIEVDPYFKKNKHLYSFTDKDYTCFGENELSDCKKYHDSSRGQSPSTVKRFKASTDTEAIAIFNDRMEVKD